MNNEWHLYDMNLYRDSFQNYKVYQIPKAQLIIADVPYNLGTNAPGGKPLTKRRCTERRKASAG